MKYLIVAALFLISACAPQEQIYRDASQDVLVKEDVFIASDGTYLPMRQWLPKKKPRVIVIALHGFNDYSNAFTGTGEYLKSRNIATFAYDQRGFGKSPETGVWANSENLVRDLQDFTHYIKSRYPKTPIYWLGESMGGAVALTAATKSDVKLSGLILSAPAVWGDEYMPFIYRPILWAAAHSLPGYKLTGQGLNILASNNIPMLRAMGRDPLIIKATRIDAIYGLTNLMEEAYHSPPSITTPTLLLYGFKDQVIPRAPIEAIKDDFAGPIETIFYDEGYHMLTRDLEGERVLKDIAEWLGTKR